MRRVRYFTTICTLAALAAAGGLMGCQALGISTSALDAQAAAQNAENVRQIVSENEAYLATDPKADSLKQVQRDRNAAAVSLAAKMAEAAK